MLTYKHLKIPESLKELIRLDSTALIIIDMQKDFCSKNYLAETKNSINTDIYRKTIKNIKEVIKHCRAKKIQIFWICTFTKKNLSKDSPSWFRFRLDVLGNRNKKTKKRLNNFDINKEFLLEGTKGAEIIDDLEVDSRDIKIIKYRSSAFHKTKLHEILKYYNIATLVIVGIYSYGCVLATALDGMFNDYYTIVLRDCIKGPNKELDKFSKKFLEKRTDLITSKKFINELI